MHALQSIRVHCNLGPRYKKMIESAALLELTAIFLYQNKIAAPVWVWQLTGNNLSRFHHGR